MGMALAMATMMLPSAAPFFIAYGRDTRRPVAVAIAIGLYVAVWAGIGLIIGVLMERVMMPPSGLVVAVAVAFALLYSLSAWCQRARERCREMCSRAVRGTGAGDAVIDGLTYTGRCVACTAGLMVPLIVAGMSSPVVIMLGAMLLALYKLGEWRALVPAPSGPR